MSEKGEILSKNGVRTKKKGLIAIPFEMRFTNQLNDLQFCDSLCQNDSQLPQK